MTIGIQNDFKPELAMPTPVNFTDNAVSKVKELIEEEGTADLKLRVFVSGGGCSGFQYGFTWESKIEEDATVLDLEGTELKVIVDAHSSQYLEGSTVAYTKTLMAEQFQISNPVAKSSCGCGSSFAV